MKKQKLTAIIVLVVVLIIAVVSIVVIINKSRYITRAEALATSFYSFTIGNDKEPQFDVRTLIEVYEAGAHGVIDYQITPLDAVSMYDELDSNSELLSEKILKSDFIDWLDEEIEYTDDDGNTETMNRAEGLDIIDQDVRESLGLD